MPPTDRVVFACSCEGTVPLETGTIGLSCGGSLRTADQLCRRELGLFKAALAGGESITVSCTQEAPLFREVAAEAGADHRVVFANIREQAGWSREGRQAGPKIAALLAAATEPMPPVGTVAMASAGIVLVYGRGEEAIAAGRRLAEHLDVTVLLTSPGDVTPPRTTDFPVLRGTITSAKGHLGAFELRVDDYALPSPSSRQSLVWGAARDGARSSCDLLLDLTNGTSLFPAPDLRSGYLRADPRDPRAFERAIAEASHLVGEFDKPRFVETHPALCAHSRSRITGCTRCLDVCAAGAIAPAGDHVAIDPHLCAGCGSCASVCPTGAAAYGLPKVDALLRRLRSMMLAYRRAGGRDPVVLFHDGEHGAELIEALARWGEGLPANVLPLLVNEATQVGPEALACVLAYGGIGAGVLTRERPRHDISALERAVATANAAGAALGYGAAPATIIGTDDPDTLRAALDGVKGRPSGAPSAFLPLGEKRGVLQQAFVELHRAAPMPADLVPLAAGAPFGGLDFRIGDCTLCLACVGACPTAALTDNPDRPMLSFSESLCVQCGLCAATCPEHVITLKPQIDFAAWAAPKRVVKEEEPFPCVVCAKPFGTRSAIERVVETLSGRHWMFAGADGEARTRVLMMCEDCRVGAVVGQNFDPHAPERAAPRTSEDYVRARSGPLSS